MKHVTFIIAVVCLAGCAAKAPTKPLQYAGEGLAGVVSHVESAEQSVVAAKPHTNPTGKAILDIASMEHATAIDLARGIRTRLDEASADNIATAMQLDWYHKNRWVNAALFVRKIAYWLIGIYVGMGIIAIVLGMNPLSKTISISRFIVRMLPAANWISSIRDWIARRKG